MFQNQTHFQNKTQTQIKKTVKCKVSCKDNAIFAVLIRFWKDSQQTSRKNKHQKNAHKATLWTYNKQYKIRPKTGYHEPME